jgi:hypothetical protein
MANQIAANNRRWGSEEENIRRVNAHLNRFWTPAMRERLRNSNRENMDLLVQKALGSKTASGNAMTDRENQKNLEQ